MDVTIIYVNWNCADEIVDSIASVRTQPTACEYEIIVVDNDSPQGIGALQAAPGIHLIRSHRNGGFGAGCNLGVRASKGEFLLFLNPDTRFLNDVLGELLSFLRRHPKAVIAGPLVLGEDNQVLFEAGRSLPSLYNEFLQHSTLAFRFPKGRWTSRPYLSRWDHLSTRPVETILGACMLVSAQAFRAVGGFDEAFFLYSEEVDLCYRLGKECGEVWYVHTARLMHKERKSTIQMFGSVGKIVLQNMKSQHYYFRKHYGRVTAASWRFMIAAIYLLRYIRSRDGLHLRYATWAMFPSRVSCSA